MMAESECGSGAQEQKFFVAEAGAEARCKAASEAGSSRDNRRARRARRARRQR